MILWSGPRSDNNRLAPAFASLTPENLLRFATQVASLETLCVIALVVFDEMRNHYSWVHQIDLDFIPQIKAVVELLEDRLLPTFVDVFDEAEAYEEKAYERIVNQPFTGEGFDLGDAAEEARDEAITYYETLTELEQALINVFAPLCYHRFEQQLLVFYRKEVLTRREEHDARLFHGLDQVLARFARDGLDIRAFNAWEKVDEFRLVANVVKHAEGDSAERLRDRRPDLFRDPNPILRGINEKIPSLHPSPLFEPMLGRDFFLTLEGFKEYAGAVVELWEQIKNRLVALAEGRG